MKLNDYVYSILNKMKSYEELEMFGAKKAYLMFLPYFQDFARFYNMFIVLICHNMFT